MEFWILKYDNWVKNRQTKECLYPSFLFMSYKDIKKENIILKWSVWISSWLYCADGILGTAEKCDILVRLHSLQFPRGLWNVENGLWISQLSFQDHDLPVTYIRYLSDV